MGTILGISAPGFGEVVALAVLALLIFGPERLPGMARNAGRMLSRFRQEATATLDELKRTAELDELRDVAEEFRSTGSELRRTAALTGPIASAARPPEQAEPTVEAGVPPFDPDAT